VPVYVRDESESILDCRAFSVPEIRRMIAENEIRDANTLAYGRGSRRVVFSRLTALSDCRSNGAADIFKFRELPENETSKPFLDHLEDLR